MYKIEKPNEGRKNERKMAEGKMMKTMNGNERIVKYVKLEKGKKILVARI